MMISRVIVLSSMLLSATLMIGCEAMVELEMEKRELVNVQTDKASIFLKLKENNHLAIDERISLYYQLKREKKDEFNFEDENELNRYGYSLMGDDKVKEAIEIFKLMVSEFPESFNAYDSLGEGYLNDGNEELSVVNYKKSLELNSKNTGAIDQINRILGLELLVTDWGKEIFHFPLHFAPEIPLEGVEEVVFPQNWIKPDSTDFWSYVFVWALDNKKEMTGTELETTLNQYFDGLMSVVNDDKEAVMNKTNTKLQRNTDPKDEVLYTGDLTIFDAFATNKPLTLNARVYSDYCEKREKLILLFRFSPLDFDHPIWDKLRTVEVRSTVCEE